MMSFQGEALSKGVSSWTRLRHDVTIAASHSDCQKFCPQSAGLSRMLMGRTRGLRHELKSSPPLRPGSRSHVSVEIEPFRGLT